MSKMMRSTAQAVAAAGLVMAAFAVPASAGSMKDAPAEEGRKLTWSFNLGGTSDYVFRGISQTDNDPTMQGGLDLGYGIFYAGVWASGLDFKNVTSDAQIEVDFYAGIKPVYGAATFDLGVIYYAYPGGSDAFPSVTISNTTNLNLDYFELKAGVSGAFIPGLKDLTTGVTFYYSPEYFSESGSVWTVEGSAAYTLPAMGPMTPTISAAVGYQDGGRDYLAINGFDNYVYYNAGLALAVDKLTFDFRYWGTSDAIVSGVNTGAGGTCASNYCDDRFVFTAKVTLP